MDSKSLSQYLEREHSRHRVYKVPKVGGDVLGMVKPRQGGFGVAKGIIQDGGSRG